VHAMAITAIQRVAELGGSFQLFTFDERVYPIVNYTHVTNDNKTSLEGLVRDTLVNHQKRTNIYEALVTILDACTKHEITDIIFMTDGLANMGRHFMSRDLFNFVVAQPNFGRVRIHTLGVQIDHSRINAYLLQQLALETTGTYRIARQDSDLGAFLGDLLAHSKYTVMRHLHVRVYTLAGLACKEITKEPKSGHSFRDDAPLALVFEDPKEDTRFSHQHSGMSYHVQYMGQSLPNTFVSSGHTMNPTERPVTAHTLQTIALQASKEQVKTLKAYLETRPDLPLDLFSLIEKTVQAREHPELEDDVDVSQHTYASMTHTPLHSKQVLRERASLREESLAYTQDPI